MFRTVTQTFLWTELHRVGPYLKGFRKPSFPSTIILSSVLTSLDQYSLSTSFTSLTSPNQTMNYIISQLSSDQWNNMLISRGLIIFLWRVARWKSGKKLSKCYMRDYVEEYIMELRVVEHFYNLSGHKQLSRVVIQSTEITELAERLPAWERNESASMQSGPETDSRVIYNLINILN